MKTTNRQHYNTYSSDGLKHFSNVTHEISLKISKGLKITRVANIAENLETSFMAIARGSRAKFDYNKNRDARRIAQLEARRMKRAS